MTTQTSKRSGLRTSFVVSLAVIAAAGAFLAGHVHLTRKLNALKAAKAGGGTKAATA